MRISDWSSDVCSSDLSFSGLHQSVGSALKEAFAHPSYNLLTLGFFVCGFHVAFIQIHLPAYITDKGLDAGLAAWALALVGAANIVGAFGAGLLGGRYSKKYLLSLLYLLRAIAIALFVLLPISPVSVLVFAAVIGLLWLSTVPLTSGLLAQFFGTRHMAMLFGIVFFSHQVGSFLGVWLGGYFFDLTGSYDIVWWSGVVLGVLAAVVHRSEEHTSELQSLMRISYAVFCLKKTSPQSAEQNYDTHIYNMI